MKITGTSSTQAKLEYLSNVLSIEGSSILLDGDLIQQTNVTPYLYNRIFFLPLINSDGLSHEYVNYNTLDPSWNSYKFGLCLKGYLNNNNNYEMENIIGNVYAKIIYTDTTDFFPLSDYLYEPYLKIGRDGYLNVYTNNNENLNNFFPLIKDPLTNKYKIDPDFIIRERKGIIITNIEFYTEQQEKIDLIPCYVGVSTLLKYNVPQKKYSSTEAYTIIPVFSPTKGDITNCNMVLDTGRPLGAGHSRLTEIKIKTPFRTVIQLKENSVFTPLDDSQIYSIYKNGLESAQFYRTTPISSTKNGIWAENIEVVKNYLIDCGFIPIESIGEIPPPIIDPPTSEDNIPNLKDDHSDIITIEPPNISLVDYVNTYIYRQSEVKQLTDWFISNTFLDNIVRLYQSPIDSILGLRTFMIDFVNHDINYVNSTNSTSILNVSTDISGYMFRLGYNYLIRGGEYHYIAYYGDYNDYVNTQYTVYVPYVGLIKLNSTDVVNKTLKIVYAVDIVGDNSMYFIYSDDIIIKCGNCMLGTNIPFLSSNYNEVIRNGMLSIISGFAGLNLGDVIKPFVQSDIDYKIHGNTTTSIVTRFIPPYLIITKSPPQIPSKLYSFFGYPTTSSGQISEFNPSSSENFVKGEIKLVSTATNVEKQMIIDIIKDGIYL